MKEACHRVIQIHTMKTFFLFLRLFCAVSHSMGLVQMVSSRDYILIVFTVFVFFCFVCILIYLVALQEIEMEKQKMIKVNGNKDASLLITISIGFGGGLWLNVS